PEARGSVNFDFKPLFPKGVSFVYAFNSETQSADDQHTTKGSTAAPDTRVGFWLEYPEVNQAPSADMQTHMTVLLNKNLTGVPSGGNNGCDGLWGAECSNNLAAWLKTEAAGSSSDLGGVINSFNSIGDSRTSEGKRLMENLSCPSGILHMSYDNSGSYLANERKGSPTEIMEFGNALNPYIVETFKGTGYDQQIEQAAVVLLLRKPQDGDLAKNVDSLQLEMACVKAERLPDDDSSNGENEDDDDDIEVRDNRDDRDDNDRDDNDRDDNDNDRDDNDGDDGHDGDDGDDRDGDDRDGDDRDGDDGDDRDGDDDDRDGDDRDGENGSGAARSIFWSMPLAAAAALTWVFMLV
ncbi:hypothetical protein FQN49_006493, partial [Arthroderma sp. PD_2]